MEILVIDYDNVNAVKVINIDAIILGKRNITVFSSDKIASPVGKDKVIINQTALILVGIMLKKRLINQATYNAIILKYSMNDVA